jgi:hypothetical protein
MTRPKADIRLLFRNVLLKLPCRRHQAMSQFAPMYGPTVRCERTSSSWHSRSPKRERFVPGLRQSKIVIRIGLARLAGLGGFRYFDKVAGVDIIDVAVNWDIF